MKITAHPELSSIQRTRDVQVREDVTLRVRALSPMFADDAEREIPTPRPPRTGIEKNAKGSPVFDDAGMTIPAYDFDDVDYRTALQEANVLQGVKMIIDALEPGQIEFEAEHNGADPAAYYRAVRKEMTAFGFNVGDQLALLNAVREVSGISAEDIEAARLGFSTAEN